MVRVGESTRLPKMWPGFKSQRRRLTWVRVCCWFSPLFREVLRFSPLPQKPTLQSKFQFDLEWRTRLNEFIRTRWCFVGKQITIYNLQSFRPFHHLPQKAMMLTGQNYTLPLTCNILLAASCTVSMSLLLATRPPMDDGTPAG